jgi:hypothetical protein
MSGRFARSQNKPDTVCYYPYFKFEEKERSRVEGQQPQTTETEELAKAAESMEPVSWYEVARGVASTHHLPKETREERISAKWLLSEILDTVELGMDIYHLLDFIILLSSYLRQLLLTPYLVPGSQVRTLVPCTPVSSISYQLQ